MADKNNYAKEIKSLQETIRKQKAQISLAKEDLKQESDKLAVLGKEYEKIHKEYLNKVTNGISVEERSRYEDTKKDLEQQQRLVKLKKDAIDRMEVYFRKSKKRMYSLATRENVSFFTRIRAFFQSFTDKVSDFFLMSKAQRAMEKMSDEELRQELYKARLANQVSLLDESQETAATREIKEDILMNPQDRIQDFDSLTLEDQDKALFEEMVKLCEKTGQTIYFGIGNQDVMKMELIESVGTKTIDISKFTPGHGKDNEPALLNESHIARIPIDQPRSANDEFAINRMLKASRDIAEAYGFDNAVHTMTDKTKEIVTQVTQTRYDYVRDQYEKQWKEEYKSSPAKENERKMEEAAKETAAPVKEDLSKEPMSKEEIKPVERSVKDTRITQEMVSNTLKSLQAEFKAGHQKKTVSIETEGYKFSIRPAHMEKIPGKDPKEVGPAYYIDNRMVGAYEKNNIDAITNRIMTGASLGNNEKYRTASYLENLMSAQRPDGSYVVPQERLKPAILAKGMMFDIMHGTSGFDSRISSISDPAFKMDTDEIAEKTISLLKSRMEESMENRSDIVNKIAAYPKTCDLSEQNPSYELYQKISAEITKEYVHEIEPGKDFLASADKVQIDARGSIFDEDGKIYAVKQGEELIPINKETASGYTKDQQFHEKMNGSYEDYIEAHYTVGKYGEIRNADGHSPVYIGGEPLRVSNTEEMVRAQDLLGSVMSKEASEAVIDVMSSRFDTLVKQDDIEIPDRETEEEDVIQFSVEDNTKAWQDLEASMGSGYEEPDNDVIQFG